MANTITAVSSRSIKPISVGFVPGPSYVPTSPPAIGRYAVGQQIGMGESHFGPFTSRQTIIQPGKPAYSDPFKSNLTINQGIDFDLSAKDTGAAKNNYGIVAASTSKPVIDATRYNAGSMVGNVVPLFSGSLPEQRSMFRLSTVFEDSSTRALPEGGGAVIPHRPVCECMSASSTGCCAHTITPQPKTKPPVGQGCPEMDWIYPAGATCTTGTDANGCPTWTCTSGTGTNPTTAPPGTVPNTGGCLSDGQGGCIPDWMLQAIMGGGGAVDPQTGAAGVPSTAAGLTAIQPVASQTSGGSPIAGLLLLAALGVGGYFLYRWYKHRKEQGK